MPRPNQSEEKRKEFLPIVARTFSDLGYRRTTTAELAERCRIRENILYRLWPSKKAMFLAAIDYVYDLSAETWRKIIDQDDGTSTPAERILDYEGRHHGEFGFYRIVFAGLSESDDPEIRAALKKMYSRFHGLIRQQIAVHCANRREKREEANDELLAWAVMGLGTVANIGREMDLLTAAERRRLIAETGRLLLEG